MRDGWPLSNWDPYNNYLFILPSESHPCLFHSDNLPFPGSSSIKIAFGCISKLAGAFFLLLSKHRSLSSHPHNSKSSINQPYTDLRPSTACRAGLYRPASSLRPTLTGYVEKIGGVAAKHIGSHLEQFLALPLLSAASLVVPPFDNLSSGILAVPLDNIGESRKTDVSHIDCGGESEACLSIPLLTKSWMDTGDTIEPQTGIRFPAVLDKSSTNDYSFRKIPEVLVGMGSRSIKVVRLKPLKVYAFGLYVHPGSVCRKLGHKYKSLSANELKDKEEFLQDLLREDIDMTVRLVVNYKGLKIKSVREAFERSLGTRLLKMNPEADSDCLKVFGSYFSHDIPLSPGTTIDFRRTADGKLITEIGGKQVGVVRNKDLCRAFFDMYIGDLPVSVQTKQEIGDNVADIIRRC